jgi:hypothetical protein
MKRWLLVVLLLLTGCTHGQSAERPAQPASLQPVVGNTQQSVVLSPQAAARLGIRTQPLDGNQLPTTAVLYDAKGASWTYTLIAPLTYLRSPITIDHVAGPVAVLSSGPAVGTPVVVSGVQELLGAEYGVGKE